MLKPDALTTELFQEFSGTSKPYFYDGKERTDRYVVRLDPLSGNVSKISEARAKVLPGINVDLKVEPADNCVFCDFEKKTPLFVSGDGAKYRIHHTGGAVTVPNLNPWEEYDLVTIYPPFDKALAHKLPTHFCFADFETLIQSHHDIAYMLRQKGVYAMKDFTNWGPHAGASQPHPHSQRKSVTFISDPRQNRELTIAKAYYGKTSRNLYDDYATHEINDGRRLIHNDGAFIATEFAPQFEHGIIVYPNRPVANILQMSDAEKRSLASATGAVPGLVFYCGVTSFNLAIHQAPFPEMEDAKNYFRWHMHIWPRRATINSDRAGAEVGYETNVIPTFPETTAQKLSTWYKEGPKADYVMKDRQGKPCVPLVRELLSVTSGYGDN